MALSSEPEVGEILAADIGRTQAQYSDLIAQLASRLHTPAEQALLADTDTKAKDFQTAVKELVTARDFGLTERIRKVFAERLSPAPLPCWAPSSSWASRSAMPLTRQAPTSPRAATTPSGRWPCFARRRCCWAAC